MANGRQLSQIINARLLGALILIVAAAALRLMPHPPNFTPIAAMALFGGAVLTRPAFAFLIPLAALFLSDLVLGFHATMPAVYIATALTSGLGLWIAQHRTVSRVAAGSVSASLLFFVLTNFAVWMSGEIYPLTEKGLAACFVAAVPFFQNTLAGDLFFSAAFFGAWALAERMAPALKARAA